MIDFPTRRQLLCAAALPVLAACARRSRPRPVAVDPDLALRSAAVAREQALLAGYDALVAGSAAAAARVAAVRADHVAHLAALLGPVTGSAPPVGRPATGTVPALVQAERAAAAAHAAAALTASRPLAQLLASLAASEASHPVALA